MSLPAPTVAEQAWMDAICEIGCCVCIRVGLGATPGEPHHLLTDGGRRISHRQTICLCPSHHRGGLNNEIVTARHPWHKRFERRYGTEQELMRWTELKVAERTQCAVF